MADIRFEEEQEYTRPTTAQESRGGLVDYMQKIGFAANHTQATQRLFLLVIVATVVAFVAPFVFDSKNGPVQSAPDDPAVLQHSSTL